MPAFQVPPRSHMILPASPISICDLNGKSQAAVMVSWLAEAPRRPQVLKRAYAALRHPRSQSAGRAAAVSRTGAMCYLGAVLLVFCFGREGRWERRQRSLRLGFNLWERPEQEVALVAVCLACAGWPAADGAPARRPVLAVNGALRQRCFQLLHAWAAGGWRVV